MATPNQLPPANTIDETIRKAYALAETPEEKAMIEQNARRFKVDLTPQKGLPFLDRVQHEGAQTINRIGENLAGGAENLWGMGKDVVNGVNAFTTQGMTSPGAVNAGQDLLNRSGLPQNWEELKNAWDAAKNRSVGGTLNHLWGAVPAVGGLIQQAGIEADRGEYGKALGNALTLKGAPEAIGGIVGGLAKAGEGLGRGLYESSIPTSSTTPLLDIQGMRKQGWQNEIPMTLKGAEKAQGIADLGKSEVDQIIGTDPSRPIPTSAATAPLRELRDQYLTGNFPENAVPIVNKLDEIMKDWGGSQPAEKVQAMKRADNTLLNDAQFRDNANVSGQKEMIQKMLEGERVALEDAFPAIKDPNMKVHIMTQLKKAAEESGKKPVMMPGFLGTSVSLAALGVLHSYFPHLTWPALTLMASREALKNPGLATKGLGTGSGQAIVGTGLGHMGYANPQGSQQ